MWQWGSRSPGAGTLHWTNWWASSSTPWCCGSTWPVIPPSPSCWLRCGRAAWPPTSTRTCLLRGAAGRLNPTRKPDQSSPAGPGDAVLAETWQGTACVSVAGLTLGDLQLTPLPLDTCTARTDLAFSLTESWTEAGDPAGIVGGVEFRTDVFDAASIETLIERFERVLVAMTTDPKQRLSSVDVLDEVEQARLDEVGNRAVLTQPAPVAVSVPALLAAQVARDPEAVALTFGDLSMTYRELDEAANRFAHLLSGYGVGSGACVALLLERSAQAVVAMLAALKTGAAYLAIDPALPAARMQFMLDDAAPIAVVTTAGLRSRLDGCDVAVIDITDIEASVVETQAGSTPSPHASRPRTTSLTSSTPRAPPALPRRRSPTATGLPWRKAITHTPACMGARCGRSVTPMLSTSVRSGLRCWVEGGWWWCSTRLSSTWTISMTC